jgi:SEC-C motif-containing protein
MRSRYSAYALGLADYVLLTTHRENAQARRNFKAWRAEVLTYCRTTQFLGLVILDSETIGETTATVTFRASLSRQGAPFTMTEKSTFVKIGARWLYHSGEMLPDVPEAT